MTRTLSKNEAQVVLGLEWRGQKTFTLDELRHILAGSEAYARFMAYQLVRKGWLERLRPGLYQLIPADRGIEGVPDLNPLAAGAVLVEPYFFSYGTACTHHGFTTQVFSDVSIACQERRRPEYIRGRRYVFAYLAQARFFGAEEVRILGQPVQMADRERSLVDALDRPGYAGGIGEVSLIVRKAASIVDWSRLLEYVGRWLESALAQRLGYLLDLHQVDLPDLARHTLLGLVRPGVKIHLGPRRRWGVGGTLCHPWNVIENVPREVLIEPGEGKRRRLRFPPREAQT